MVVRLRRGRTASRCQAKGRCHCLVTETRVLQPGQSEKTPVPRPARVDSDRRKGPAALQMAFKTDPVGYLRFVSSLMPKEFVFEASMAEMDDQGIDDLIEHIRARLIEERAAAAVTIEPEKMLNGPEKA